MLFIDPLNLVTLGKISSGDFYINPISLATLGFIDFISPNLAYKICLYHLVIKKSPQITTLVYRNPANFINSNLTPEILTKIFLHPNFNCQVEACD